MTTSVFLDLEDTVIKNWENPLLMNMQRVSSFLDQHELTELHIFSFAIYDDKDKAIFERDIKDKLERVLGLPIVEWMSCLEMMEYSFQWTGMQWQGITDFIQCRGKHYAFYDVMQARERDRTCILIDDAVPHMNRLSVPSSNLELLLVNVANI